MTDPRSFAKPLETGWFEDAQVGFLAATPEGRVLRVNPALLAWTGHTEETLAGAMWTDALLTPAGRIMVRTHLAPMLAAGERPNPIFVDLARADGGRMHVLLTAVIHGGPGATHHRMTFMEAVEREAWEKELVDARRLAEDSAEALRELNLDLERKVAGRTELLARANRDLDAFVRTVAHDLRNPLQVLQSLSDVLAFRIGSTLAHEDGQILTRITEVGSSMATVVDALLQLACAKEQPLRKQWVDLSALAGTLAAEYQASEPAHRVTWEIESGLRAWGDPGMVAVILRNLLGNALKYSSRMKEARITFGRDLKGFYVRDNGAGFDPGSAPDLFEPFQRFHDRDEFPGQGIGLATVKRIVDRHGGVLSAESAVGQGAAFRFTLPEPEGAA